MAGRSLARISRTNHLLRWLVQPHVTVRATFRPALLGKLLSAPAAIFVAALNGLVMTTAAGIQTRAPIYLVFGLLELLLLALRAHEVRRLHRQQAAGTVPVIDRSVRLSIYWCALQGALAFTVMADSDRVLMILSAVMVMSLIGPLCARNYAAPRLAMLLVCLCVLPFVAGAVVSGIALLLVLVPMTPTFLFGVDQIIRSFHGTLVEALEAEAQNRFHAHHDALTGLLNRYGLDDRLASLPSRPDQQVAVLCLDLDGFKQVNDRYGHAAGDRLLEQVGSRLRAALRSDDLIARLGGDEFLVMVRGLSPAQVERVSRRLIGWITQAPYVVADSVVARVGASIGYACFPEDAPTTAALRVHADQALYAAKANGKGVSCRFEQPLTCSPKIMPLAG